MKRWLAAGPPVTVCHHTTEAGVRYSFWQSEVSPDEGIIGGPRLREKAEPFVYLVLCFDVSNVLNIRHIFH